ncbi:RusA family crossover junction endodeoxyribonuclease [Chryseobacterium indoltheticum]|jgi:Holliday junction resolvase RusA-like endonuclease|uniref:RusA family crossover junction endodeoxyribonuclease n=1 Tax=Chryseobacterium indoltheticum TaxID=254 RepID=UPI00242F0C62|nr:RusA family crossover junction endodeoxyribonuclease [Chryseobacterium indoltheticum]MDF2833821.1 Endodeoxyribonuclease RusA [Chryseobacterium indoltheticum]
MKITVDNTNCDFEKTYLINELATSHISFTFEFEKIVSRQSKKLVQENFVANIKNELKKYNWIIVSDIQLEIYWYLNAVERQETDKIGDLDNITKPLIDSFIGFDGIIVDDSQIASINTLWMSRNDLIEDNVVKIKFTFNNDYSLKKENLIFVLYSPPMCTPMNIDLNNKEHLNHMLKFFDYKSNLIDLTKIIKEKGANFDRYLLVSEWHFHRTRLSGFPNSMIYTIQKLQELAEQ